MEDDQSTIVATSDDTPAEDSILQALTDTEDESAVIEKSADSVDETVETKESSETETESEVEQPEEETEATDEVSETKEDTEAEAEIDPKEEARRRYEERQRAIQERKARIQEQTKDYVEEGEDEYDQRLRKMEVQQYAALVENNENQLITEFERVKANPDLQIFNPENKEQFNQRIYDKAIRDYNAGYINYDENGNMIEVKESLFKHLTETAELFQGAVKTGAIQQVRATKKMQTNADSKPASTPKEETVDPILDILSAD